MRLIFLVCSHETQVHNAWNAHVEYVITKAAKRLYALRLLKRAVLSHARRHAQGIYTYNIRLVLEYAAQVWQLFLHTFLMLLNPYKEEL